MWLSHVLSTSCHPHPCPPSKKQTNKKANKPKWQISNPKESFALLCHFKSQVMPALPQAIATAINNCHISKKHYFTVLAIAVVKFQ